MINKLLIFLGLRRDVGAPVHAGANPVYFTYVYPAKDGFIFSWHDAAHAKGLSRDFCTREGAELFRELWEETKASKEHARFVRP